MKIINKVLITCLLIYLFSNTVFAHSGRTDSSGGHKDNNNVSGLGSYHYHHGYDAHLHNSGICPYSPQDTINISNQPTTMVVGETIDLSYEVIYYSGSDYVNWTSSDESVIVISGGSLKAVGNGNATITAKLHNGVKTFNVAVSEISVSDILFDNTFDKIPINSEQIIDFTIIPENATNKDITFTSSDENVATVNKDGVVFAVSEGVSTIILSSHNGVSKSFEIEVYLVETEKINIVNSQTEFILGEEYSLVAEVLPTDASDKNVMWETSSSDIAIVDKMGNLILYKEGNVTVTAMCGGVSDSISVTIIPNESMIERNEELSEVSTDKSSDMEENNILGILLGIATIGGTALVLFKYFARRKNSKNY